MFIVYSQLDSVVMILYGSSDHLPAIQVSGSNLLNIYLQKITIEMNSAHRSTYIFNEIHKYSTDHKLFTKINKINTA